LGLLTQQKRIPPPGLPESRNPRRLRKYPSPFFDCAPCPRFFFWRPLPPEKSNDFSNPRHSFGAHPLPPAPPHSATLSSPIPSQGSSSWPPGPRQPLDLRVLFPPLFTVPPSVSRFPALAPPLWARPALTRPHVPGGLFFGQLPPSPHHHPWYPAFSRLFSVLVPRPLPPNETPQRLPSP